ncbi:vitamin K epoxide reductase family protein [Bifidobacterium phasiani]|uniref:Vitamin K epoxide reductase family protein n=1 Tax=Bifidobacterium phasiani TaxID=2834431 RepID=A0ABS6WBL3_9BIFI|nr:vitamin K epoxide reductase family protein [Bifidobacterium phasiani]MBW3083692.1 vitamin K epoxide reductase family protein [Bifidobacterium phasiani]
MTASATAHPTTSPSPATESDGAEPALTGWRHGAVWTYGVVLVASLVALVASFVLSAETLELARHPGQQLACDVNGTLSCSTVMQSWQAEIVKFAGLSYPNAFFGIAAESVFVTIAVVGMCRVAVPRWFAACTWLGGLAALAYSYWLTTQSMFVIHALCPWCLTLMFATTIQFMALSHATAAVRRLPARARGLRAYYRLNIDLMIDLVWVLALVTLILVVDGPALFS